MDEYRTATDKIAHDVLNDRLEDFRPELDRRMAGLRELVEDHGETVLTNGERDFYRVYRLLEIAEARLANAGSDQ